eukprot:GCRY01002474.1.p1 GENE.GCRY01002474.1~~GCRY01002474.1.p1  ORF type:complete len:495 (+),score=90.19 GCRY01002474.1:236-1720(+)
MFSIRKPSFKDNLRFWGGFVTLFLLGLYSFGLSSQDSPQDSAGNQRNTLTSDEYANPCDSKFDTTYGYFVYSLAVVYLIIALGLVCDHFFVPSLEIISNKLELPDDVAGSTLMAAGTSLPELFTAMAALFSHENDAGLGAVLGSTVYNIFIIIGAISLLSPVSIKIDYRPIIRDVVFFFFSVIILLITMFDKSVHWYESGAFVLLYVIFAIFVYYFEPIRMMWRYKQIRGVSAARFNYGDKQVKAFIPHATYDSRAYNMAIIAYAKAKPLAAAEGGYQTINTLDNSSDTEQILDLKPHKSIWAIMWSCFVWPIFFVFGLTVPDCRKDNWKGWYLATFLLALGWIGVLTWVLVDLALIIGCLLDIPPVVMGLTGLAWATSLPDTLSSVFVAGGGMAEMAVSNAIGSNVFDIAMGLGFPWLAYNVVYWGQSVAIDSKGVLIDVLMVFFALFFFVAVFSLAKWRMSRKIGLSFVLFYIVYAAYTILESLDIVPGHHL